MRGSSFGRASLPIHVSSSFCLLLMVLFRYHFQCCATTLITSPLRSQWALVLATPAPSEVTARERRFADLWGRFGAQESAPLFAPMCRLAERAASTAQMPNGKLQAGCLLQVLASYLFASRILNPSYLASGSPYEPPRVACVRRTFAETTL